MKRNAKARTPLFDLDLLKAVVMVADCGTFTDIALLYRPTADAVVKELARALARMFGPQRR